MTDDLVAPRAGEIAMSDHDCKRKRAADDDSEDEGPRDRNQIAEPENRRGQKRVGEDIDLADAVANLRESISRQPSAVQIAAQLEEKVEQIEAQLGRCTCHALAAQLNDMQGEQAACEFAVSEIFSPPRTSQRARERSRRGGYSLDCEYADPITGRKWDLDDPRDVSKFWSLRKTRRSKLLIASPPCRTFSQLEHLRREPRPEEEYKAGRRMLRVAVEACKRQHEEGLWFILEHPRGASSWNQEEVGALKAMEGVYEVNLDQCQFGQWSYDKDGTALALKPTRILTNMRSAMEVVGKRCQGGHRHVTLLNGKAGPCAQYPFPLVDAFLRCVELEERALRDSEVNLCNVEELHEQEEVWENCEEYAGWYDELTGEPLDPRGVKEGRQHEMSKLWERDVYEWVPRESVRAKGGRILRTRWVQNRKGQGVKCRFVGMEFAKGNQREDLFAGTPPLWAARLLISRAASGARRNHTLMALDVSSAFLYADVLREMYIELPEEDVEGRQKGMVGRLKKALYGTRDAPLAWQEALGKSLREWGFRCSRLHPALYYHEGRDVCVVVHVDDMLCAGAPEDLQWYEGKCKASYEITRQVLEKDGDSLQYLGRTVRKVPGGYEWEADEKHLQILREEWGMLHCNVVNTPVEPSNGVCSAQLLLAPRT